MTETYRIFGSELSPYSVKVRSYFRYKQIPHEWIPRSAAMQGEFDKYAKLPLVPLVVTPEGRGIQDSTPIIETFEAKFPEPSIVPEDKTLAFLSALIEEYADEWGNKPMFHYRWTYPPNQDSAAERLAAQIMGEGAGSAQITAAAQSIKQRMIPRLAFVGSSPETLEQIEASYRRQLEILEKHLASRAYLLGGRPALGDFGLFAQLYELRSDPTPKQLMARFGKVSGWIDRMLDPRAQGPFETWDSIEPTLLPLLEKEIAAVFLPWSDANARALAEGRESFEVNLEGRPFSQHVQKYHARSLGEIRRKFAGVAGEDRLRTVLERSSCLTWLSV
jgi:glutathione S-transferase